MPKSGEQYWQDDKGLWVENVGQWAREKQKVLADYVQICGNTRKKFKQAAFIDVFSGPGKSKVRSDGKLIDGSPIVAFKQAMTSAAPFSQVCISDADAELLKSAESRLHDLGAPVFPAEGPASKALPTIVKYLDRSGLHLVFLDPHNLGTLSFDLFETIARLKYVDVIVHVSVGDLQRNVDRYTAEDQKQFDSFAPDWRKHVKLDVNQASLRAAILEYWTNRIAALGLPRARHCQLIRGDGQQRLYWLMLLARHELAHSFWSKVTSEARAPGFDFGQ